MPPKSKPEASVNTSSTSDELSELIDKKLDSFLEKIEDSLTEKIDSIKMLVNDQKVDYTSKIDKLSSALNHTQQHSRNSSVRVFGLKVDAPTAKDALLTSELVYKSVFLPILELAKQAGSLETIPAMMSLIEYAHCLPTKKKDGDKVPIIIRFQSRLHRSIIFKYKKEFLSKNFKDVFIVDDLTPANHKALMELKSRGDVASAWSFNGKIKYTLKSDEDKIITLKN